MGFKINKGRLIFIIVIVLFIALNPTYSNFKEFTGLTGIKAENLHKKNNFLLFSIYENTLENKKYLGFLKNFINITSAQPAQPIQDSVNDKIDSTADTRKDKIDSTAEAH